mgnify:CR=1 FL=1
MDNEDVVAYYHKIGRTKLIRGLKEYLRQNNRVRTKRDGFKKNAGNGLRRPNIGGVYYSWTEFSKLPKDVIIVFAFMEGCTPEFLQKLTDDGFFVPFHVKHKDKRIIRCGERWVVVADDWKLGNPLKGETSMRWN